MKIMKRVYSLISCSKFFLVDAMSLRKVLTIWNTVKYLKPIQVVHQIKGKIPDHRNFAYYSGMQSEICELDLLIPGLDDDEAYISRFDLDGLMHGRLTLLHYTTILDGSWHDSEATHLFNFNLHYFEYAVALAVAYRKSGKESYKNRIRELYTDWQKICNTNQDACHPYTVSLRFVNLAVAASLIDDREIQQSLYPQYRYLIDNQEKKLLGNHYFENLKTIVLGSLLFGEDTIYQKYIRIFIREVAIQVLPDGCHYELSPMYHKIVMEGLLRTAYALKRCGKNEYQSLLPYLQRMTNALASLERGMGKTPFFNDAADGVAKDGSTLVAVAKSLFGIEPQDMQGFPDGGYYKLYDADKALMFDAGTIGPSFMPGHGHCDCLSFELSVGGVPLFANVGTYQYQCDRRRFFRSTAAHNTLMLNNREQSECWGEHRVARRVKVRSAMCNAGTIFASCQNYYGDIHERSVTLHDGLLQVMDKVTGSGEVRSFLHLADGYRLDGMQVFRDACLICEIIPVACNVVVHEKDAYAIYSPEFGELLDALCLEFVWQADDSEHGYHVQFHMAQGM